MKKHFLEKRFLIENELRTWANEDRTLSSRVSNICKLLSQLAGGDSKKTKSRSKRRSEPIVLDGADDSKQKKSKKNETIEIDLLSSDDEGDKKPSAKLSSNDVVDLTWYKETEQAWYAYTNITSITTIYHERVE